jgi:hypothetical protein
MTGVSTAFQRAIRFGAVSNFLAGAKTVELMSAGVSVGNRFALVAVNSRRIPERTPILVPRVVYDSYDKCTSCGARLLRRDAPARCPILGLHLVAPAKRAGPIAEVSIAQRPAVNEPYDDRSVRTRTNHSVRRQAIGTPHSPHDGRLVIHNSHRSFWHVSRRGKGDTSPGVPFSHWSHTTPPAKVPGRKTKVATIAIYTPRVPTIFASLPAKDAATSGRLLRHLLTSRLRSRSRTMSRSHPMSRYSSDWTLHP